MSHIRCFLLEPTDRVRVALRRYTRNNTPDCCPANPGTYSYHAASTPFVDELVEYSSQGYINNGLKPLLPHDDPRWPQQCACGYTFHEGDEWQRNTEQIFRRADTGEEMTIQEAPVGAMWHAWWFDDSFMPQGEHNLAVKTPGGEWLIDSQANNCTIPGDRQQKLHHCWIRHGTPPDVTVNKEGGPTCQAGAGSIQIGDYHGFLRGGYLER